ncbi:MAG: DUF3482 domain-containing protein, partial [Wenzhouxiangella sp.]
LLAWRQLELLAGLRQRGHAAQQPLRAEGREHWTAERLPRPLARARHHPEWSSLNPADGSMQGGQEAVARLAAELQKTLESDSAGGAGQAADHED